jgi:hypothetical protein
VDDFTDVPSEEELAAFGGLQEHEMGRIERENELVVGQIAGAAAAARHQYFWDQKDSGSR